ncbi:MAG: FKBP-type peptidyl-prolyl cis-trans isomerase, partial [Gammaproteobacteria bacterium]|nr:FKBP-type peptidyl-prolyl cis-trans isomerase [Gammaproteobacteria bacterium]
TFTLGSAFVLLTAIGFAQDGGLTTDEQKFSYSVGFQVGSQIQQQFGQNNTVVDPETFAQGVQDALSNSETKITPEEMQAIMQAKQEEQVAAQQAVAGENKAKGDAFLAENKEKEGVVVTESGLQYKVVTAGEGKQPAADSTVVVHYSGRLIDGTEFDSSYKRETPATFALGGIIPGWGEALQLMKEGAKWQVFIPSELGYGERGAGGAIGPNETLVFDIELLEVK